MGGIYKSKKQKFMSLATSLHASNLEEPTATGDRRVPNLVAESSVSIKNMSTLNWQRKTPRPTGLT